MRLFAILSLLLSVPLVSSAQKDTLTIFLLKGCERCIETENFAKANQIPYRVFYNEDSTGHRKLGEVLDAAGFKKGQLSFPIVTYKGKTHFNIPDLKKFLATLVTE
jgi:glutaredoxin